MRPQDREIRKQKQKATQGKLVFLRGLGILERTLGIESLKRYVLLRMCFECRGLFLFNRHGNLQVKDSQALVDELESAHRETDNFLALK